MTLTLGIWRPNTSSEISEARHTAGLYGADAVEVWTQEHLEALLSRLGADLISLELDTHAIRLSQLWHPTNPFFLIGPKNGSIPREVLDLGRVVQVETPSPYPLQPAVAAAIVLHDNYLFTRAEIGTPV